ncbi:hypothetical protein F9L00_22865 [Brucella anthropi]|jgi:hypothetical protein|uniref:Uncharacterized protein n=1 Tax=Brucella anthropi TaxID=529 RepID=A0A6L3Z3B9_BRUAN|nr:hypothetical protein [Brucella anthropi]KAB2766802.1 hypothetical protein F9L04_16150 [Brucella anthropi]KAB2774085.1 hypothetical protein F9L00_22865 [Brucella anthropi]
MKITITTSLSGPTYTLEPGAVADFAEAEALRLINAGFAIPATNDGDVERAVKAVPSVEKREKRGRSNVASV